MLNFTAGAVVGVLAFIAGAFALCYCIGVAIQPDVKAELLRTERKFSKKALDEYFPDSKEAKNG